MTTPVFANTAEVALNESINSLIAAGKRRRNYAIMVKIRQIFL